MTVFPARPCWLMKSSSQATLRGSSPAEGSSSSQTSRRETQHGSQGHAFLLAAGKLVRGALAQFFDLQVAQRRFDQPFHFLLVHPKLERREGQFIPDGRHEQLHIAILENQADPAAELKVEGILQEGLFGQRFPESQHRPLAGKIKPIQNFEQGAFTGTVRTQDGQPFPRPDGQADVVQGRDLVVVVITESTHFKNRDCFHNSYPQISYFPNQMAAAAVMTTSVPANQSILRILKVSSVRG